MPAQFDLKITGLDKALDRIAKVPDEIKLKGLRFAMRKAANLVRDAAKQGAQAIDDPRTAEEISKNIVVRWNGRLYRRTGDVAFRVGVLGGARAPEGSAQAGKTARRRSRLGQTSLSDLGEIAGRGAGNPGGDTWHWRLVEYGTSRSRAQPFMAPALRNNTGAATAEAAKHMHRWLDRNYGSDR